MKNIVALLLAVTCSFALAQQREPTDAELKTAYCIEALQNQLAKIPAPDPVDQSSEVERAWNYLRADLSDKINRLRSYLLPRISYIDSNGLFLAVSRAKKDFLQVDNDPSLKACNAQCWDTLRNSRQPDASKKHDQCYEGCVVGNEPYQRVRSCSKLSWLPF